MTLKLALAPATAVPLVTTSAPLIVGCAAVGRVDDALDAGAPRRSPAEIAIETGELVYQPALQAAVLQVIGAGRRRGVGLRGEARRRCSRARRCSARVT